QPKYLIAGQLQCFPCNFSVPIKACPTRHCLTRGENSEGICQLKSLFCTMSKFIKQFAGFCAWVAVLCVTARAEILTLNKGDHVCLVGHALADRMQHDGWLETLIVAKPPQHDLVFRNLAVSGDEV